ncbi:hypothetical protein niasHT_024323 [Heterodera trifolii]|uniref:Innexin n=1 Tax=Heterodera trifolii TaxID=157864 RepID=A0ABD2JMA9_9BILA
MIIHTRPPFFCGAVAAMNQISGTTVIHSNPQHIQNNGFNPFRRRALHGRETSHYQQAAFFELGAMILQNMFGALSFLRFQKDDDLVDRLSYFYTSSFLIMMAVLVSFKQFGGRPLECWVPAQFTSSWEAYTEMFCWSENTYFVPVEEDIPEEIAEREFRKISYYQWVPFFLLIQAFLFYVPCLIWRLMSDKSGIRLNDIVQMATEKENIEPEYRMRTIESLARHIEAALRYQHTATSRTQYTLHRVFKCFNLRYYESYVTGMYLATKVFYVGNVLTNLLLVNKFLETNNYSIYGLGVLYDLLLLGKSWTQSGNFPRVTLCDFEVRVLGNIQRHSVQCVLVINIFNEKIFILLWLWFCVLFFITLFDALYWFSVSLFHRDRFRFVLRHLELTSDPDRPELFRKEKRKQVEHFLRTYLKIDGVLVLRMIALHAGVMYCTEITDALWKRYLSQHPENLIDEDSVLINFARTQSIRRRIGCSASSSSLAPNHNGTSGGSAGRRVIQRTAHARLSRFLSYRQSPGSPGGSPSSGTAVATTGVIYRTPRHSGGVEQGRLSRGSSPLPMVGRSVAEFGADAHSGQLRRVGGRLPISSDSCAANTQVIVTPSSRPSSRQENKLKMNHKNQNRSEGDDFEFCGHRKGERQGSMTNSIASLSMSPTAKRKFSSKAFGLKSPLKALRSAVLSKKSTASAGSGISSEEPLSALPNHIQQFHQSSPTLPSSAPAQYRRKISFLDTAEEGGALAEEEENRRSPVDQNAKVPPDK